VTEISHTAFKENFDLAQASVVSPRMFSALSFLLAFRRQYNEAVLMANGKFKQIFAQ
jgi:hypothetical protein